MSQAKVVGTPTSGFSNVNGTPAAALVMHCSLPADIQVGEKLRLGVTLNSGSLPPTPSGWSPMGLVPTGNAMMQVYERVADGSEGSVVDVQLHATTPKPGAFVCMRIADWEDVPVEFPSRAQGQNNAPNPSALSPTWGNADALFAAIIAWRWGATSGPTLNTYPGFYPDAQVSAMCNINNGCGIAFAHRNVVGGDDPGVFAMSGTVSWVAHTVAQKSIP